MSSSKNHIATAEISGYRKNIMGTLSFDMKVKPMRKTQDFIVYPVDKSQEKPQIKVQSNTRIALIDLSTGKGVITGSYQSGAYFHHLQFCPKKKPFLVNSETLKQLLEKLGLTAGESVGSSVVKSDNSGITSLIEKLSIRS